MHAIDEVLQPLDPALAHIHKEPTSTKKLLQGDGHWDTTKVLLGWLIDTVRQTIQLPQHRYERLCQIFSELRGTSRVSLKNWCKVLGELRSMVLAIPGGRGLFSTLQTGLRHSDGHRVRINRHIRRQLDDFEALAKDLHLRPTRLGEIVRDTLSGIGACDAAGPGMGGVWFIPNENPILWRSSFPVSIQKRLVTWSNPRGDLTNSDLELAAIVAQQDVLCQRIDTRERTFCTLTDNTPALSWARKGSVTSEAAAAYLLRLNSLHQRHHRYLGTYDHIAGKANVMADDASRLWNLRDSQLLAYFQQTYPQSLPWKFTPLRQHMRSALISALSRKPVALQSALNVPNRRITSQGSNRIGFVLVMRTRCC